VADVSAWEQTYTDWQFVTATITAGAESLRQSQGGRNGGAASSTGASSGMNRASGTTRDSNSNGNSGSRTTMHAASETTGAAYKYGIEGAGLLALAGAAALNAW
jgi:hypothetical protein